MREAPLFEGMPADRGLDVITMPQCKQRSEDDLRCLLVDGHVSDHFNGMHWFETPKGGADMT